MSNQIMIFAGLISGLTIVLLFFLAKRAKSKKLGKNVIESQLNINPAQAAMENQKKLNSDENLGCNLSLTDENGVLLLQSREIDAIPLKAHRIDSGAGGERVKHLAADLFKGVASIPNKTVQVVFRPDIQKGLADGTYRLMQSDGQNLADAVNATTGQLVGKGRIMQGGKARQIASGAFQLVSIAVAQSHMADIETSLGAIKSSIAELNDKLENEEKSRITGSFDYLTEISLYMQQLKSPLDLSLQKRVAIEGVIKDSFWWRNRNIEELASLIKRIKNLEDKDTFGTGSTYERLKDLVLKIGPILKNREFFLNLASAIDFVTAFLDPTRKEFSRIGLDGDQWDNLIEDFKSSVSERRQALISKSIWNSSETLQLRNDKISALTADQARVAFDQRENYLLTKKSLDASVSSLIGSDGTVRLALSFDAVGEIKEAAIL